MPHKLLKLVMLHLKSVNNDVVVAAWSLIAKWCLMMAQWDVSGDSLVAFSVKAMTEGEDKDLSRWLKQRLSSTLGARPTIGSSAGATVRMHRVCPVYWHSLQQNWSRGWRWGLWCGVRWPITISQGGVGDGESKQSYSTEDIAALREFVCLHRGQDLATIWDYFTKLKGKNIDNYRRHITNRMKQGAYDCRMEIDKQDTIAIVDLKFNPGEGVAHLLSALKGLSILTCRSRTMQKQNAFGNANTPWRPRKVHTSSTNFSTYPKALLACRPRISGSSRLIL
jgi:hypothetical protein